MILLFTFGTLPAIAMPLLIAVASILNTFSLIWLLTYITDVSIIVQFLVALVGLGVAIDYALLMIFRFREELRHGADRDEAIVQTMRHAGRSVIVSGSTVAVGLLSMIILPLPFIRSIGIGGMLIPAVSVLAAITLLPALLYTLGPRINSVRVCPGARRGKRRPGARVLEQVGALRRAAGRFRSRPPASAIVGALLYYGVQLNPARRPGQGLARRRAGARGRSGAPRRRDHRGRRTSRSRSWSRATRRRLQLEQVAYTARRDRRDRGRRGASGRARGRPRARRGVLDHRRLEPGDRTTITRLKDEVVPAARDRARRTRRLTLAGLPTEEREFIDAVYGNFPYVLLFVVLLTYMLLMRAFRSVLLPLKAVILNLVSLGAAYGIIVFIFQKGHGAEEIWNVPATDSIISWIPLMIFAFLYGLSMDYEVFMLTRMREAYDETGDTNQAIALGLARTGKLVTSAALVLMFAFFVLSTSPARTSSSSGSASRPGSSSTRP